MSASRSSVQRWLMLVGGVLLAHLALLQSIPADITPADQAATLPLTFATRSIEAPNAVTAVAPRPKVRAPRPKTPTPVAAHPPDVTPEPAQATTPDTTDTPAINQPPAGSGGEIAALPATPAASEPQAHPVEPETRRPAESPAPLRFNAQSLSASRKLIYTLKTSKFPFTLNAELLWLNRGDSYSARLRYSAFGVTRAQTSQGQITDAGLAPERFSDKYRSEVAAHFNYELHKITFSANTPDAPLLDGAQDRLSVLLQIGGLMASEPARYEIGSTITIQTVGARSADLWLFTVIQTVTLDLPGGTVQAIQLERNPREPYDQKVEVWLSPDLNYLPVRIRITETNGDSADQQWSATQSADTAD